jgi:hypothetical protein
MKLTFAAIFVATLVLSACASSTPVMGPNGKQAFAIECGSAISTCYEEAANTCPNGYNIIDKDSSSSFYASGKDKYASSSESKTLLIQCK